MAPTRNYSFDQQTCTPSFASPFFPSSPNLSFFLFSKNFSATCSNNA